MPYLTKNTNCAITPKLPKGLEHKPVFAMPYQSFDGIYSSGTDIRYISVGMAQYDNKHASIKTMRHTGNKWSRQSEELPLHRVIDMANFLAQVLYAEENGSITIPPNTFQNQTEEIIVTDEGNKEAVRTFAKKHDLLFKERFRSLKKTLDELASKGAF